MEKSIFQILRESELEAALRHFPPGCRVLELGGGTGWQARLLTERGFRVESLDIELYEPERTFFPVRLYDGVNIPFDTAAFDVVFSSNVMEHVQDRPALMKEIARVCAPAGKAIHLLPNSWWRLCTLLGFYPYKLKKAVLAVVSRFTGNGASQPVVVAHAPSQKKAFRHKFLYDAPHGEFPSAFAELWYFSSRFWRKELAHAGFAVESVGLVGDYAYHGASDFSLVPLSVRARVPRWLGRPVTMYVLRKAPERL